MCPHFENGILSPHCALHCTHVSFNTCFCLGGKAARTIQHDLPVWPHALCAEERYGDYVPVFLPLAAQEHDCLEARGGDGLRVSRGGVPKAARSTRESQRRWFLAAAHRDSRPPAAGVAPARIQNNYNITRAPHTGN